MNSLRQIIESSPSARHLSIKSSFESGVAQPLGPERWDWGTVRKLLVIRLRSIGDAVLTTPSLFALRRFLPQVEIHILLEDWVAPLLNGQQSVALVEVAAPEGAAAAAEVDHPVSAEVGRFG